jgi:acyl-CoA synthetase (AMP-forming)/AMP-acid ligase II
MRIYKSSYPDVPVPTQGFFQYLTTRPISLDLRAFVDYPTKRTYTRGQVFDRARRLAKGLRQRKGVKPGDTVLIYGKTSIEYPVVVLGCIAAGLVPSLASAA